MDLLKQMERNFSDTGPQPNRLITKFKTTRQIAWVVFGISAVVQITLLTWLILDAFKTKNQLQDFELGVVATCPASKSQNGIVIKAALAGVALVGTGIGLALLSSNPMNVQRVLKA